MTLQYHDCKMMTGSYTDAIETVKCSYVIDFFIERSDMLVGDQKISVKQNNHEYTS